MRRKWQNEMGRIEEKKERERKKRKGKRKEKEKEKEKKINGKEKIEKC